MLAPNNPVWQALLLCFTEEEAEGEVTCQGPSSSECQGQGPDPRPPAPRPQLGLEIAPVGLVGLVDVRLILLEKLPIFSGLGKREKWNFRAVS